MINHTQIEQAFMAAIAATGMTPPSHIVADGKLHRFSANGKPHNTSGWYSLHLDGVPAGVFGNWGSGLEQVWSSKSDHEITPAEREFMQRRVAADRAAREFMQEEQYKAAAVTCQSRYNAAVPADPAHAYAIKKNIILPGFVRQEGNALLVPVCDARGEIQSLQAISPDGSKRFATGGRMAGGFCIIGDTSKAPAVLIVCEGFATGASLHAATGCVVVVAFNAGNLKAVAVTMRSAYPAAKMLICGDDDKLTNGNPGRTKANEAARVATAVAVFPDGLPEGGTDFNDLAVAAGLPAVQAQIEAALDAATSAPKTATSAVPELTDDQRMMMSATLAVVNGSFFGDAEKALPTEVVIGRALRHRESGLPEAVGLHIAKVWSAAHGGDAVKAFLEADPDYKKGPPLTTASILKLASQCGWVKPLSAGSTVVWDEPQPLPSALPPVERFDAELLPEALRGWVADIAHRMQCPIDFTAVGAVVALSSIVGARAVIKPKAHDDWAVVPNLWGVVVGNPGVMKSPALGQVMAPLNAMEAKEREALKTAVEDWKVDCKLAELTGKLTEKEAGNLAKKNPEKARELLVQASEGVETPEPRGRRFIVGDATVEKLADLLTVNQWGLMVYRDELHGLLCSMDKAGQEGSRGFYLTGFDGTESYAVDRIIRGESYVPRVCLSLLGGMQPGKLQSYVREAVAGGTGADGLLQRFNLAVWPDISREFKHVDQWPDRDAKRTALAVFERLAEIRPASETDPQEWRFSPEAQELFNEWWIPFETEIRGDEHHPAFASHLSKYRKLVPALALLFALIDAPDGNGVVQINELFRALAWAKYLRTHAVRIYSAATTPETSGAAALLAKIKAGKLCDGDGVLLDAFTPRQVAVKGWAGLNTPDDVRKAAAMLADYGWLAGEVVRSGDPSGRGRPSERFLVNPVLLTGGNQ